MKTSTLVSIIMMVSAVLFLDACCPDHRICHKGEPIPNLFVYEEKQLLANLTALGYTQDYLFKVGRNSRGTVLHFESRKHVLVADAKGSQRHMTKPAQVAFLNDEGDFVAWTDDYNKGVHFRGGYTLKLPKFAAFGVDHSGEYYFFQSAPKSTQVFRTKHPGVSLASANMRAERIFVKNEKIYLFTSNQGNIRGPGDYEVYEVFGNIFNITGQKLNFEREIRFPRPSSVGASPFTVLDLDPYSDQILFLDVFDAPSRSKWHLGTLNTNKLTNLGTAKPYAYFLRQDIIVGK